MAVTQIKNSSYVYYFCVYKSRLNLCETFMNNFTISIIIFYEIWIYITLILKIYLLYTYTYLHVSMLRKLVTISVFCTQFLQMSLYSDNLCHPTTQTFLLLKDIFRIQLLGLKWFHVGLRPISNRSIIAVGISSSFYQTPDKTITELMLCFQYKSCSRLDCFIL